MQYKPMNYHQINLASGTYQPNTVKSYNNATFVFWERALFQRAISVIDFENLPYKAGVQDFFKYCLYNYGFLAFFKTTELGVSFQPAALTGFDFYYQPVKAIVANPLFHGEFTIGKDCEILKLTPDYMGIIDIVSYYAEKMATCSSAIDMSLINSKFAFILGAKNKSMARVLKTILDEVNAGNPAVIYDASLLMANDEESKDVPWQEWQRDVKNSYITADLLRDWQTILNAFDAEIGIPTIPYQKKERMVADEANSRVIDSITRSEVWLKTLTESLKDVNSMFGLNIVAKRHDFKSDEGGADDGKINTL